jgi:polysaccharide biosynthesis/export protein
VPTVQVRGTSGVEESEEAMDVLVGPAFDQERLAYRIGAGDILAFKSFNDEGLNREVQVRYDGRISLDLIPDIEVRGYTRAEAEDLLRQAYGAVFTDPQVSLTVTMTESKNYYVMGDVNSPSQYPYLRPITILDAINIAGGLRVQRQGGDAFVSAQGQLTKAFVIRHYEDDRAIIECDLRHLTQPGPHASETPIYPDDIVYVPEGVNLVYVLGEVRSPGVYQLTEGMTMRDLLARTGGHIPSSARTRHVVFMRDVDQETTKVFLVNLQKMLKTGDDMLLKPGDVVYVLRKPLINLQEFINRFASPANQLMNLYQNAYSTYYTKERFDRLFKEDDLDTTADILGILQSARDLGIVFGNLPLVP